VKSLVRWGGRYGLARSSIRAGARAGDLHARMVSDPAARADPYPIYDEVRAAGAFFSSRFALLSARHDVVSEVLRHPDFRVGFPVGGVPTPITRAMAWARDPRVAGPVEPPSMLAVDGADHARYRRLVGKAFTARAVEGLRGDVESIANHLLDGLTGSADSNGPLDLVTEYAATLPVQVIAGVLGVPTAMQNTFLRWGKELTPSLDIDVSYFTYRRCEAALRELNSWLLEHFTRLRAQPGDDLLSRVILAGRAESGPELNDTELTAVAGLVLTAGFETTVNLLGNAVVLLLNHRDQLEKLQADPTGWANAVEEVLRYDSPVQNTARHAAAATVVHERELPAHQFVVLLLGAANRDPAVFLDPARFDVTRPNARDHLAFSAGSHYCLGAALARAEGEIGLRLLFERFPDLAMAGEPTRRPTRILRGWAHLPVTLRSASGAGRPAAPDRVGPDRDLPDEASVSLTRGGAMAMQTIEAAKVLVRRPASALAPVAPIHPKGLVRWGLRHGMGRTAMAIGLRQGEVFARLVLDTSLRADPYPYYAELRATAPLVPGRFALATTRHDVIEELLRHPDLRSGFPEAFLPGPVRQLLQWATEPAAISPIEPPSMLVTDGPGHDRHRRAVSRAFTVRAVRDLEARVEVIATELLEALPARGPVDLVGAYTDLLPVQVIAEILGVPPEMNPTFLRWGHAIAKSLDVGRDYRTLRHADWAVRELNTWLLGHFARLRRNPGSDLLSRVITLDPGKDAPLTDVDLVSIAGLVLGAGFETTVNLLSNGISALTANPDQLELLRAEPAHWPNAVQEILRYDSPVQNTFRHAGKDLELFGTPVPKGKLISLVVGGANRDPSVFPDPDRFDITRGNAKEHLSFGGGSHYCLGATLARLEGEVGLRLLFEHFPGLQPAGPALRRPTRILRGFARFPVELNRSPAPA